MRLGSIRWRLAHPALHLMFGEDDRTILACGYNSLFEADRKTGLVRPRLDVELTGANFVISANGRVMASLGAPQIRCWDLTANQPLSAIGEEIGPTRYSPPTLSTDGSLLAAVSKYEDKTEIHVWETATGKRLNAFPVEEDQASVMAFSPDCKTLAYGGSGKAVRSRQLAANREGPVFQHDNHVTAIAFSPDGRILSATTENGYFHLWDAATGRLRDWCTSSVKSFHGDTVVFSPDGKLAAHATDRDVILWDTATGRELKVWSDPGRIRGLAFSRDGKTLAAGGEGQVIRLWDVATKKLLNPPVGHEGLILDVAFSPDGRRLASAGEDGTVRTWDVTTGRELGRAEGHTGAVNQVIFKPDGRSVISVGADRSIRWLEVPGGREQAHQRHPVHLEAALSPDGTSLACFIEGGHIRLFDGKTGEDQGLLSDKPALIARPVFASGGRVLTGSYGPRSPIQFWDVRTRALWRSLPFASPDDPFLNSPLVAVSPDGRALVSQDDSGRVRLWETATVKERRNFGEWDEHRAGLAFSADGRLLVAASRDGNVLVWDLVEDRELPRLNMGRLGHHAHVPLVFSPDGRLLASIKDDTTILLWPAPTAPRPTQKPASLPEATWDDLASADAKKAFAVMRAIRSHPAEGLKILENRVRPVVTPDPAMVARLMADLNSDQFAIRERASAGLAKLRDLTVPALRDGLKAKPSPETQARIEKLLTAVEKNRLDLTAEEVREIRVTEILEGMGTPEAKQLLEALAKGVPEARLTQEAKESLTRLNSKASLSGGTP